MWWSRDTGSLDERIRKRGLERVAGQIKASARDCIRLKAHQARDEAIPLGASKLGGQADLPESTEWPGGDDLPMSFLAQINTNDLPDFKDKSELPADTLLSFFYDIGTSPRGYHPKDRGGWKVLATPRSTLVRRGIDYEAPYNPCLFTARKDLSLPDPASDEAGTWNLSPKEFKAYTAFYEGLMPRHEANGENHQLLGYASTIQGDMHVLCHWASQGLYWRTAAAAVADTEWPSIQQAAADWRLLFQIDSDSNAALQILEAGRIYFYMRDSALKAHAFEEAWAVVQKRGDSVPP
jgi:uncharacterized protein YwqG